MASRSWTLSGGGSWSTLNNWSSSIAPLRGDDVTIILGSSGTVTYGGTQSLLLSSLVIGNSGGITTLAVTGGTLATRNGYSITGALSVSTGTLQLRAGSAGATVTGGISQLGGMLAFNGTAVVNANQSSSWSQTGGTLLVNNGVLYDSEALSQFGGTIAGNGVLNLSAGNIYFNNGIVLNIPRLQLRSSSSSTPTNLNLSTSLNYGGALQLGGGAILSLNNRTFTSTGSAALAALYSVVTNGGTLQSNNAAILDGLVINGGATVSIAGTANQTGTIAIGEQGSGTLSIGNTGVLRLSAGAVTLYGGAGIIFNNGTIAKTGGSAASGYSVIDAPVVSTGTIDTGSGVIDFHVPVSGVTPTQINGTLTGNGTALFDQGNILFGNSVVLTTAALTFTGDLGSNVVYFGANPLSYGGRYTQLGGLLFFQNRMTLTGPVALDGGQIKGTATLLAGSTIPGVPSAVHLGNGMDLEGNMSFEFGNSTDPGAPASYTAVVQSGQVLIGALSDSLDQVTLAAGSTWLMEGNSSIVGSFGTISNYGYFAKTSGATTDTIYSVFFNKDAGTSPVTNLPTAAGTLSVATGTLAMRGHGALGGVVSGGGVLDIGGSYGLSNALSLTVANVVLDSAGIISLTGSLTYANNWSSEGGGVLFNQVGANGSTLTLNGTTALLSGAFLGAGVAVLNGPVLIGQPGTVFQLAQGADMTINGIAEQAGTLQLSSGASAPTLTIGPSGTYTLDTGALLGGTPASPAGNIVVQGTLRVVAPVSASGTAVSVVSSDLVNTGTVALSVTEMQFMGAVSGTGKFVISQGGILDLMNSNGGSPTISFGAGGGTLMLQYPNSFAGEIASFTSGDALELIGFTYPGATEALSNSSLGTNTVLTVTGGSGNSASFTFTASQTLSGKGALSLGVGPHGGLSIYHT